MTSPAKNSWTGAGGGGGGGGSGAGAGSGPPVVLPDVHFRATHPQHGSSAASQQHGATSNNASTVFTTSFEDSSVAFATSTGNFAVTSSSGQSAGGFSAPPAEDRFTNQFGSAEEQLDRKFGATWGELNSQKHGWGPAGAKNGPAPTGGKGAKKSQAGAAGTAAGSARTGGGAAPTRLNEKSGGGGGDQAEEESVEDGQPARQYSPAPPREERSLFSVQGKKKVAAQQKEEPVMPGSPSPPGE